jgi:hypothetical protein
LGVAGLSLGVSFVYIFSDAAAAHGQSALNLDGVDSATIALFFGVGYYAIWRWAGTTKSRRFKTVGPLT